MISGFLLQLFYGLLVTIELALCSLFLGLFFGIVLTLCEVSSLFILRVFTKFIIFIVRGLPELLVLFFIYFGVSAILNQLFNINMDVSPFLAGMSALSIIFAAYASQVLKGAFNAIHVGQLDAAHALGFSRLQTFIHIQLPQAWRHAIPGLGNLWLALLKDTSLVMLVGISDLMSAAKLAASTTRAPFTFYLIAAGMYLSLTLLSQRAIHYFSYKANQSIRL